MTKKLTARIVIGGFILLSFLISASVGWSAEYGPYTLTAPIATDGDTIRGDVNIWPDLSVDASIRVAGVDTPELKSSFPCERALAVTAKKFTDTWILENYPLTISRIKQDKFSGRFNASVTGSTGDSLAGALIAAVVGRPYAGGARQPWCSN